MLGILLSKHLLILVLVVLLSLVIVTANKRKIIAKSSINLYIALLIFLLLYLFIVGNSLFLDIYYQWDLNKYDLNKDGFFSGDEINENQKIAMKKMTNDTSRNLSFITGGILSFVLSLCLYLILVFKNKFKKG